MEKYPQSVPGTGAPPKVGPIIAPSFNQIGSLVFKRLTLR